MAKKKLKPTLPSDEAEILEKGFLGNLSDGKKFITDGHSLLLADKVVKGWALKKFDGYRSKDTKDGTIQKCWDDFSKREGKKAEFIGCGKADDGSTMEPMVVAVLRQENGEVVCVNPWILKFALSLVGADALSVSSGKKWTQEPMNILRGEGVVGMLMPMRYSSRDLDKYDLTGPAIPLIEEKP